MQLKSRLILLDKVLIIKHNQGHYGFPKGHVEKNETEQETAIRETKEETNIDAIVIGQFKKTITYSPKRNVIKDVIYFIGKPTTFNIINGINYLFVLQKTGYWHTWG